jgi:triphosphatase
VCGSTVGVTLDPADSSQASATPAPLTLGAVAHAVVRAQLEAVLKHEPEARVGDDPEAVHQMRVATRRLRAGLRLFADVAPVPVGELLSELAWLAERLGAVRDLDVQIESIGQAAAEVRPSVETLAPVLSAFESRRASARHALLEALDGPRYVALVAALSAVVAQSPGMWPGRASEPAAATVPALVRARFRKFRKAARHATATSPATDLHRARIRAKRLRYSLEFVADLYGKRARSLIRRIVDVQDVLGAIQDAAVMDQRLRSLGQAGHELPAPSVFVLGQLAQCYAQHADASRKELATALRGVNSRRWRRLQRGFERVAESLTPAEPPQAG